ncbi:MAG: hypothetical protein ACOYUB_04085 [Patescibacteria group bacterium]
MEFGSIGQLEFEKFGKHTQINIGDATMLATLQALGKNRPTIMIDQNTDVARKILEGLSTGTPPFEFLRQKKYYFQYASISERVLADKEATARMDRAYRMAWEDAKSHLEKLTIVNSTIEDAVKTLKGKKPVADLITYYYPSRVFSPVFTTLELASMLLKPGGEFVVATENEEVMHDFAAWGGQYVTASGYKKRSAGDPYLSAYDIAWGEKGHFEVRIKNRENKLYEYVSTIKKGFAFKAMSALGMVK